jgi:nucleotide-binding universal stress UspA family protein
MAPAQVGVEMAEAEVQRKSKLSLKKIMVATDFSPASDRALDYAVSLARRFGSEIYLTHIIPFAGHAVMEPDLGAPSGKELRWIAEENIRKIENTGRLFGVPHDVVIEEGSVWPALEEQIQSRNIELLVLGTHGMGAVGKLLTGSTAEEVFRKARIPVLTVGPAAKEEPLFEAEFRSILFATDFGTSAENAAAFAFALAQEHRAKLTLLHVFPEVRESVGPDAVRDRDLITHQMKELLPSDTDVVCKVDYHVSYGHPAEEILRLSQALTADLIVMGAKRREGLAGHVPHTKAYRVVCGAKCPVLTIKS